MTKEDDKEIEKLQLQLQIEQAKARGEEARLKVAETNLESEFVKGMGPDQKLKYKAVGSIDKALSTLDHIARGDDLDHIARDEDDKENSNSNSGNGNNNAVESNR